MNKGKMGLDREISIMAIRGVEDIREEQAGSAALPYATVARSHLKYWAKEAGSP
jgi:hypothetical protein